MKIIISSILALVMLAGCSSHHKHTSKSVGVLNSNGSSITLTLSNQTAGTVYQIAGDYALKWNPDVPQSMTANQTTSITADYSFTDVPALAISFATSNDPSDIKYVLVCRNIAIANVWECSSMGPGNMETSCPSASNGATTCTATMK